MIHFFKKAAVKYSDFLIGLILAIGIGGVYGQTVFFDFLNWDDLQHVTQNVLIRSLAWKNIVLIFQQFVLGLYIPLTTFSFAIEYKLFGLNSFYVHLDNIFLHFFVTVLVYRLGIKLGLNRIGALLASLLFGIHPIHVSSVAWVTERKDVLYSFFYLLSMLAWLNFIEHKKLTYYLLSWLLALISMLSKPMAVSLPLMLLLLDWFKSRADFKRCFMEKIPFLACGVFLAIITLLHNPSAFSVDLNPFRAALIWMWTLTHYIQAFVWPFHLQPIYRIQEPVTLSNSVYIFSFFTFIAFVVLLIKYRKSRWFVFGLMTYVIMIFFLLRFKALESEDIVADRFMYLPCVGFCYVFGKSADFIYRRRKLTALFAAALILLLAWIAFQNSKVWKNDLLLWNSVIQKMPNFSTAYLNRGAAMLKMNRLEEAMADFNQAIMLDPQKARLYLNRGTAYLLKKEYILALDDFNQAIVLVPEQVEAYFNRAILNELMGKDQDAINDYTQILLREKKWEAYYNRGVLLDKMGDQEAAQRDFIEAVKLNSDLLNAKGTRP